MRVIQQVTREKLCESRKFQYTSVMSHHCGASLSADLLICHCTKQDLSRTSIYMYVNKSSPEIVRYCICMSTARAAMLRMHKLSFTLKS